MSGFLELGEDGVGVQIEHGSIEQGSILEHLSDLHLVLEWIDLELIEKSGFSASNLVSLDDHSLFGNDIDLSRHNLGLDLEGLEELGLFGIKTSWTSWNHDISWSDHTRLSRRWSDFGIQNSLHFTEVTI